MLFWPRNKKTIGQHQIRLLALSTTTPQQPFKGSVCPARTTILAPFLMFPDNNPNGDTKTSPRLDGMWRRNRGNHRHRFRYGEARSPVRSKDKVVNGAVGGGDQPRNKFTRPRSPPFCAFDSKTSATCGGVLETNDTYSSITNDMHNITNNMHSITGDVHSVTDDAQKKKTAPSQTPEYPCAWKDALQRKGLKLDGTLGKGSQATVVQVSHSRAYLPEPRTTPPFFQSPPHVAAAHHKSPSVSVLPPAISDLKKEVAPKGLIPMACKVLSPTESERRAKEIPHEARIHKSLDHPGILPVRGAFWGNKSSEWYFMMLDKCPVTLDEVVSGKTVVNFMLDKHKITKQLVEVLDFLHSDKHIVHRDIKLANIMLTQKGDVQLTDFGYACHIDDLERISKRKGTPNYMPPEMVREFHQKDGHRHGGSQNNNNHHHSKMQYDVWALGITLYSMWTERKPPFERENMATTLQAILGEQLSWPEDTNAPPLWIKTVIMQCLSKNPSSRPSSRDLARIVAQFSGE